MKEFPKRSEIDPKLCWDLTALFKTQDEALKEEEKVFNRGEALVENYEGKLKEISAADKLIDFIYEYQAFSSELTKLSYYHYLGFVVDMKNPELREEMMRVQMKLTALQSKLSFIDNELAAIDEAVIKEAIEQAPQFKTYLSDLLDERKHRLSPETEAALAHLAPILTGSSELYDTVKFNDMHFSDFEVEGKSYPNSYVLYENNYSYEPNTEVRRAAFKGFSETLGQYRNITAAIYNQRVQYEKRMADLRGFDSVFDYLLHPQKVTREMYDRQIDTIMDELRQPMRRYAELIKKVHGLKTLYFSDLKLPLDPEYSERVTPTEAKGIIEQVLSVMGEDYKKMLMPAFEERWLDFAQNDGKSTGGFACPIEGVHPYILLNWDDGMAEVFTLIHELGHAGQFLLTEEACEFFESNMSMYSVESPSTFHETLLAYHLSQDEKAKKDPRYERWIWSLFLSNTYYHNFVTHLHEAAYQREVYKRVDQGEALTADDLDQIFKKVLEDFWGDTVVLDEGAERTWMRQPHYYSGLYSFTYSAGLTIGTEMFRRLNEEGPSAMDDWKKFLAAGGRYRPLDQAALAGVDISNDKPLKRTIQFISELVDRCVALTEKI